MAILGLGSISQITQLARYLICCPSKSLCKLLVRKGWLVSSLRTFFFIFLFFTLTRMDRGSSGSATSKDVVMRLVLILILIPHSYSNLTTVSRQEYKPKYHTIKEAM